MDPEADAQLARGFLSRLIESPEEHLPTSADDEPVTAGDHLRQGFGRSLRMLGLATAVFGVFAFVFAPRFEKSLDATLLNLGQELAHQPRVETEGERTLVLNGQPFSIQTGTTTEDLQTFLGRFEGNCQDVDGVPVDDITDYVDHVPPGAGALRPTVRADEDGTGYVACIDVGSGDLSEASWRERFTAFAEDDLDVEKLGTFRYVYAEDLGERGIFYVAIESAGQFRLQELFPDDGDVPGHDPEGFVRPPESQRIFQGYEDGQPYSMTVFSSPGVDPEALERHYRHTLPESGWTILDPSAEQLAEFHLSMPEGVLVFERPAEGEQVVGDMLWLFFQEDRNGRYGALTTVLESQ